MIRAFLSGIIFVNGNGVRWRDAPKEYGPAKKLYNRWKRWSGKSIQNARRVVTPNSRGCPKS